MPAPKSHAMKTRLRLKVTTDNITETRFLYLRFCMLSFNNFVYSSGFTQIYFMFSNFIEQKQGVLGGKPVIKGTRIGVDLILEKIGAGETMEDVLKAYPFLNSQSILACISYGAASVRNETLLDAG